MKRIATFFLLAISIVTFGQNSPPIINTVTLNADTSAISMINFYGNAYAGTTSFYRDTSFISFDTTWHYLAITIDINKNQKVYVDGELKAHYNINKNYNYSSLYIGAQLGSSFGLYLNGVVDEFRISKIERSEQEIFNNSTAATPLSFDDNTVELFRFNESNGAINTIGENATVATFQQGTPQFVNGKHSNGLKFNGINDVVNCNINPLETDVTFEIWVKLVDTVKAYNIFQTYGTYSGGMYANVLKTAPSYLWSTGDTTASITVNPDTLDFVWASDGSSYDTVFFNTQAALVYDTLTTIQLDTTFITAYDSIAVTDTLIIDAVLTGVNPPDLVNTIKIYPNPAKEYIIINTGNYMDMQNYGITIVNMSGATVFETQIEEPEYEINLSTWTGKGTYLVKIYDPTNKEISVKKIILQ